MTIDVWKRWVKSGVKGRGSDRWWERRWWLWWGNMRRMRWTRRTVNTMRLTEWRRELIPQVRWCIMWKSGWWDKVQWDNSEEVTCWIDATRLWTLLSELTPVGMTADDGVRLGPALDLQPQSLRQSPAAVEGRPQRVMNIHTSSHFTNSTKHYNIHAILIESINQSICVLLCNLSHHSPAITHRLTGTY